MSGALNYMSPTTSLFDALVEASRRYGPSKAILEDQERRPLSYTDLIRASFALGGKIAAMSQPKERIGVLLPSSAGGVVTIFALTAFGRVPAMLNFTAGIRNLRAAVKIAKVRTVLTSRRFVEQAKLHDEIDALEQTCKIVYLEDVRARVTTVDRLVALAAGWFPSRVRTRLHASDEAMVLFTSGSFGAPRGVVLTHGNVVANVRQIAEHIPLNPDWVMFNPLPIFHSFGLTAGAMLPLLCGLKAFQYPSPLHVKLIPPLIRDTGASVLFAAEAGDLSGLAFIVCGAERVRDETHDLIAERFGPIPVLEGYGATEASPVIAVNTPTDNRRGTVGGVLPGIETRLEPVAGIAHGAQLFVRGPNIMAGYLDLEGKLEAPAGGWHDTGDMVEMSNDRWITILGRVKRFAKVGGEMVSLSAAEALAAGLWPDARHAVISLPDARKGERLILVTDQPDADAAKLLAHARALGASELAVPRRVVKAPDIPVLGTGKTDYVAVQRLAETEPAGR
jgi:acyl-[acyl-carrier-protein]-phospholipid O-acyltransferase/long-chain-fatty-acid--[acyl-carrier-protein] ligase